MTLFLKTGLMFLNSESKNLFTRLRKQQENYEIDKIRKS